MAFKRALWHSGLTYRQTCDSCHTTIQYTDYNLDFRPWYPDGFVYCQRCKKPLRHNESYAINAPVQNTNPNPEPVQNTTVNTTPSSNVPPVEPTYNNAYSSNNTQPMFCSKCGKPFNENDVFCSNCSTMRNAANIPNNYTNIGVDKISSSSFPLVLAILSCALNWIPFVGLGFGIPGLIFGIKKKQRTRSNLCMLLSIIGLATSFLLTCIIMSEA